MLLKYLRYPLIIFNHLLFLPKMCVPCCVIYYRHVSYTPFNGMTVWDKSFPLSFSYNSLWFLTIHIGSFFFFERLCLGFCLTFWSFRPLLPNLSTSDPQLNWKRCQLLVEYSIVTQHMDSVSPPHRHFVPH